jgi:hypothetical protein
LSDLHAQWELQKEAQLSVKARKLLSQLKDITDLFPDAPACLWKELDSIIVLQGKLDNVENAIQTAWITLANISESSNSLEALQSLKHTHEQLNSKAKALFTSLNIRETFSELKGIYLSFVQTLFMAHNLKINIRKHVIGSFFEWDRLDQAVGGREAAMGEFVLTIIAKPIDIIILSGTKLHQSTRRAITKCKPAILAAIHKFNKYCSCLSNLHHPEWSIPLPEPLPMELSALHDSEVLMEDVWIMPSVGEVPRWIQDPDIQQGIHAMLKLD